MAAGVGSAPKRANATSIRDAKVVSLKGDYDLAILNVGRQSGVQVGPPFQLLRKDRPVGTALVVDVRDHICGVILQDLVNPGDPIKLGDTARLDPTFNQQAF